MSDSDLTNSTPEPVDQPAWVQSVDQFREVAKRRADAVLAADIRLLIAGSLLCLLVVWALIAVCVPSLSFRMAGCAAGAVTTGLFNVLGCLTKRNGLESPWILFAALSWIAGEGIRAFDLANTGEFHLGVGHVVLVSAMLPVLGLISQLENKTSSEKTNLMWGLDTMMLASLWVLATWRLFMMGYATVGLGHGHWDALFVVSVQVVLMTTFSMRLMSKFDTPTFLFLSHIVCVTMADIVGARAAHGSYTAMLDGFLPEIVTLSWVMSMFGMVIVVKNGMDFSSAGQVERGRTLATAANSGVAVMIVMFSMIFHKDMDQTSTIILYFVVGAYIAREWGRGVSIARLVDMYKRVAKQDHLTEIGNRPALFTDLAKSKVFDNGYILALFDLDDFKAVNEHFGHAGGDAVLGSVGDVLGAIDPSSGTAYRLGGNEFAVVAPAPPERAREIAESYRRMIADSMGRECKQLGVTVSGSYCWSEGRHLDEPSTIFRNATDALADAKKTRNVLQPYTTEVAERQYRERLIEKKLENAIETGKVTFLYQPIVDIASGRPIGVEALARWQDDELGFVSPPEFVATAERVGLIYSLGLAAVRSACETALVLRQSKSSFYVSVNVSPIQLRFRSFVADVINLIAEYGVPTDALKFEVTENIHIDSDDPALWSVRELREAGFAIALDDFGAGYSSIGYMGKMPYDVVKLDRSITQSLSHPVLRAVVTAMVKNAAQRGLTIISEGVETEDDAALLTEIGVTVGQGWLWSKAVPRQEMVDLLAVDASLSSQTP